MHVGECNSVLVNDSKDFCLFLVSLVFSCKAPLQHYRPHVESEFNEGQRLGEGVPLGYAIRIEAVPDREEFHVQGWRAVLGLVGSSYREIPRLAQDSLSGHLIGP